jgi:uncharacterized protein HemX
MTTIKHVIILIFTVCITVGIGMSWYYDKKTRNTTVVEEISQMKSERDSLFNLADNVVNKLIQEKEINQSQIDELNRKVAKGEMTLSQKDRAIKEIVKRSGEEKTRNADVLPKEVAMMAAPDELDGLKRENDYLKHKIHIFERLGVRNEELSMELDSLKSQLAYYESIIATKDSMLMAKKPKRKLKFW